MTENNIWIFNKSHFIILQLQKYLNHPAKFSELTPLFLALYILRSDTHLSYNGAYGWLLNCDNKNRPSLYCHLHNKYSLLKNNEYKGHSKLFHTSYHSASKKCTFWGEGATAITLYFCHTVHKVTLLL